MPEPAEEDADYGFTRRRKDAWSAEDIADLPPALRPDRAETLDLILRKRVYLLQSRRGYRANTDSQLLAFFAWARARQRGLLPAAAAPPPPRVLDLGAGTGLVSILFALAAGGCGALTQVELQGTLAGLAARNLQLNGVRGAVVQHDLADGLPGAAAGACDVVLVNPPFYRAGERVPPRRREKRLAHVESSAGIAQFAAAAAAALDPAAPAARAFVVYDVRRAPRLLAAVRAAGLAVTAVQQVRHAPGEQPARVLLEAALPAAHAGADVGAAELPPLVIHPPGAGLFRYNAAMEEFLDALPEPALRIGQLRP